MVYLLGFIDCKIFKVYSCVGDVFAIKKMALSLLTCDSILVQQWIKTSLDTVSFDQNWQQTFKKRLRVLFIEATEKNLEVWRELELKQIMLKLMADGVIFQ